VETTAFERSERSDETTSITLGRRDLRDAIRLLRHLVDGDHQPVEFAQTGAPIADRETLIKRARRMLAERQKRYEVFGRAMFGEPAWDMLLILYIEQNGLRLSIARLSQLAGASGTTALRWLEYLEVQGWVRRIPHPTDRRTFFLGITDRGLTTMDLYLSETVMPVT
jgi:DNA-binding MarR family transcriptional regulator